jgi:hypothetical protein
MSIKLHLPWVMDFVTNFFCRLVNLTSGKFQSFLYHAVRFPLYIEGSITAFCGDLFPYGRKIWILSYLLSTTIIPVYKQTHYPPQHEGRNKDSLSLISTSISITVIASVRTQVHTECVDFYFSNAYDMFLTILLLQKFHFELKIYQSFPHLLGYA